MTYFVKDGILSVIPHNKTNKISRGPAKTQISHCIHPVWSVFNKDWSDWVEAQADPSFCWAHWSFCWFCRATASFSLPVLSAKLFRYSTNGNDPKFLDRQVWPNSVDPDQTAPRAVWSGSTLFAILALSFGCITVTVKTPCSKFSEITANFSECPNI